MSDFQFKEGTKIEISAEDDGFRGAWFSGTVIKPPAKRGKRKVVFVEYDKLVSEQKESKRLRETIDLVQIRPIPPRESTREFQLSEEVDANYNDGWWEGVVTEVLEGCRYSVYFRSSGEQLEFGAADLRLHREWDNGKWVPPTEEEKEVSLVAVRDSSIVVDSNKDTGTKTFSKGSLVEVSSDEDGFQGAWFSAMVVDRIGEDKFLVEYKDLRTEDDKEFVKEQVDDLHIRPSPPEMSKAGKFKLYEEVDALYNDGWWVGVISKILSRSNYLVYFKGTNEELQFKQSDLRPHQEWIDGKWVRASEALNLSG
ncbi:hypothetical protein Dimus_021647 [Dionaea muscipula]